MAEFFIPVSFAIFASVVMIVLDLVKGLKFRRTNRAGYTSNTGCSVLPDLRALNCRVRLTKQKNGSTLSDVFCVEICGSIHAPGGMHYAIIRISIADIADGITRTQPVHSRVKQWQIQDSPVFVYSGELGRLPNQVTTLTDWVSVAQLPVDWLLFPRQGKRKLQLSTAILSRWNGQELACGTAVFDYENNAFGYIDLQENTRRAKTLTVALALAVSAADNKLPDCELELIKRWARDNIDLSEAGDKAGVPLERALSQTVDFLRGGNQIDAYEISKEFVEIAPLAERYDALELCLLVARADGTARAEELALLGELAMWLKVDVDRFRHMMEKILPVGMHECQDAEVILGVSSEMGKEQARQHLNKEYRKWNARVTNFDPHVQAQADQMLRLIAAARSEYVG